MRVLEPNFEKRGGLVTVVAQDVTSGEILMVAHTDRAGYLETLKTGYAVYYSTSRKERWMKGETSGDKQVVLRIIVDCDGDALVYKVYQRGKGACHTNAWGCFYRDVVSKLYLHDAPKETANEKLEILEKVEIHQRLRYIPTECPNCRCTLVRDQNDSWKCLNCGKNQANY